MKNKEIEKIIKKIELNSFYVPLVNEHFTLFDPDIAVEITVKSQENLNNLSKEFYKLHGK